MFGKWKSLTELYRGLEFAMNSSAYGIPEILVINIKYEKVVNSFLMELGKRVLIGGGKLPKLCILILAEDDVCEECAALHIRVLSEKGFPGVGSLVNVKYFGISQDYVNAVTDRVQASF